MFNEEINKLSALAEKKTSLLEKSKSRYLMAAALPGMFIGLGIILIYTIGGYLSAENSPMTKTIMGISFGIALSLVLMAGGELFTSNNMIMTIGALEKKISWILALKIWIFSYVGNFIGSIIVAALYTFSNLASGHTGEFILKTAATKMSVPFGQLFVRGILCNILVCLSVWCFYKLKEETAKLIMIFWCLFAFITSGYEHSIANMTLLSIALMIPHSADISIAGAVYNLVGATLGNFVGGAIFVGASYWYISSSKNQK